MANDTAVLNPFQTKRPERLMPLGGIIGGFNNLENDLRDVELNPDKARPIAMASEGSIVGFNQPAQEKAGIISQAEDVAQKAWEAPFLKTNQALDEATSLLRNILHEAPSAVGNTVSDIKDLFAADILGIKGELKPEASKPLSPEEIKIKANAQEVRSHNARIGESTQLLTQAQEALMIKEEKRVTNEIGTPEDSKDTNRSLGYVIRKTVNFFFEKLNKRVEQKKQVKAQQEKKGVTKVKPVMGIDEMFKGYERSGGGHWSTSVG